MPLRNIKASSTKTDKTQVEVEVQKSRKGWKWRILIEGRLPEVSIILVVSLSAVAAGLIAAAGFVP